jgi:hypothetical protein
MVALDMKDCQINSHRSDAPGSEASIIRHRDTNSFRLVPPTLGFHVCTLTPGPRTGEAQQQRRVGSFG